jgi:phage terminase large subunit-like protein
VTLDLNKATESWRPEDKLKLARAVEARTSTTIQRWYCNDRLCSGRPHEGYDYRHARADQWPPVGMDWFLWLLMSGRGAGKTRSASEWVRYISRHTPQIAIIGRRGPDVRDTMVEGISGLEAALKRAGESYVWYPSKKQLQLANGCLVQGYSAEEPDSLRGANNGAAWLDEPAHMDLIDDVWHMLTLGLRVPGVPGGAKVLATTTPLPKKWLKEQIKKDSTRMVRVSTRANLDNLDDAFKENVLGALEGTRLGRQEIEGEILEDVPGALWQADIIAHPEETLSDKEAKARMDRIVVAIDPAGTANKRSDETGMIVLGRMGNDLWVLEDLSGKYSPGEWANLADQAYRKWHADAIVAEKNFGGEMVEHTLLNSGTDARILITTAARSKALRAEPVVAIYERQRVWHNGYFPELEEEMLTWVPGEGASPNRVDALVHGAVEVMKLAGTVEIARPPATLLRASRTNPIGRARAAVGNWRTR